MSKLIHIDKYDTIESFCGVEDGDWEDNCVHASEWRESPTALSRATCIECLNAVYTLGQWAANVLSRIPQHNHPPAGASVSYTSAIAMARPPCPACKAERKP